MGDPARVYVGDEAIEEQSQRHDQGWHPLPCTSNSKGEDEGSMHIVELPKAEQNEGDKLCFVVSLNVDGQKDEYSRGLHQDPTESIGKRRSPTGANVASVGGRDKDQRQKREQSADEERVDELRIQGQFGHTGCLGRGVENRVV